MWNHRVKLRQKCLLCFKTLEKKSHNHQFLFQMWRWSEFYLYDNTLKYRAGICSRVKGLKIDSWNRLGNKFGIEVPMSMSTSKSIFHTESILGIDAQVSINVYKYGLSMGWVVRFQFEAKWSETDRKIALLRSKIIFLHCFASQWSWTNDGMQKTNQKVWNKMKLKEKTFDQNSPYQTCRRVSE